MSARKLQQEVDRTFKRVGEGIQQFESIYDKLQQCTNASQKEKLEDSLKREIKKLQRHRDQIKTWAANSEIKDKKPLLDERKKIETQMEKFKAVEKEMKTKAYSKEGLLASARLDPKAQQKQDMVNFLSDCTADLDRQIEAAEAEAESITATLKRGKKSDSAKAERVAEVERKVERHKWHQQKLELIMRLLENGQLDLEQVERIKEDIKWYVDSNQDVDFAENDDDTIYDELNLDEEVAEDIYGMGLEAERMSSQDTTSVQDDMSERPSSTKETANGSGRRPSAQLKSPLPAAAVPVLPAYGNGATNGSSMKPAPLPARPAGELKYASVATAAAAAEKNVGIAPLPPPPGVHPVPTGPAGMSPLPPPNAPKQPSRQGSSPAAAPAIPASRPVEKAPTPASENAIATPSPKSSAVSAVSPSESSQPILPPEPEAPIIPEAAVADDDEVPAEVQPPTEEPPVETNANKTTNGTNGAYTHPTEPTEPAQEESIYHLPPGLQDLMSSFETTKKKLLPNPSALTHALEVSFCNAPDTIDSEKPKHYRPTQKYNTPPHYPQEPLAIFDDPALYRRIDPDTLFFVFYYRQGTYQQYLAAKELKRQSWRFHKQYQTWFQRHEEPKSITEEYEQGTYRFFDYESTWMNRRKSDFKFIYKYLEDDL